MKCSRCHSLNAAFDTVCAGCRQPLVRVDTTPTPQWAYFFAVACGAIPLLTLGGLIPAALGFGGASSCLAVSRVGALPSPLRLLACVVITGACWFLLVVLVAAIFAKPLKA
jgi:hypothetical protein